MRSFVGTEGFNQVSVKAKMSNSLRSVVKQVEFWHQTLNIIMHDR